jgi:glycosyltransferase involved in cell wall biosynthesis
MTVAVLMPAYNEKEALRQTLHGVRAHAEALSSVTVFLVDDGSDPPVAAADLPAPTGAFRVVLARHAINLGQGAALETARKLALGAPPFSAYVTMDADGQHCIEDMRALVEAVRAGADVAFGNRFSGDSNVPALRRAVLLAARVFERTLTGLSLSDAHNGYRAFSRRALGEVHIRQNRMAHATEIKQQISRATQGGGLSVVEVPVSVRYTRESLEKGQSSLGVFTILRDLFYRYLFEEPE